MLLDNLPAKLHLSFAKVVSVSITLLIITNCQPSLKPMDVNSQGGFDNNLFLKNPTWQFTFTNYLAPDPTKLCPVQSSDPQDWKSSPTCTSQPVYMNIAEGWNNGWCKLGRGISGHVNWFPVTYEGTLYWSDHSGNDDDYNFKITRNDHVLYTGDNNHLQLEFDSDETVDNWDNTGTYWEYFHHQVDNDNRNGNILLDKYYTIAIGLLGLDGGHSDFGSELHPVYAMFIHTKDDPADDRWLFFIRNWGDEGYCSSRQEYLYLNSLQVLIPHENADDVDWGKNCNIWTTNTTPNMSISKLKTDKGVLLSFTFDNPEKKECFFGDLDFNWSGKNIAPRNDYNQNPIGDISSSSSSLVLQEEEDGNPSLNEALHNLDSINRRELFDLLNGKVKSPNYPLYPKPTLTRYTTLKNMSPSEVKNISLRKGDKQPDYSTILKPVNDSTTAIRKKMRQELIENFLKGKGIKIDSH